MREFLIVASSVIFTCVFICIFEYLKSIFQKRQYLKKSTEFLNDNSDSDEEGFVHVTYGALTWDLKAVGKSVAWIRKVYNQLYDISDQAQVYLNGELVSDGTVLKAEDNLEFLGR